MCGVKRGILAGQGEWCAGLQSIRPENGSGSEEEEPQQGVRDASPAQVIPAEKLAAEVHPVSLTWKKPAVEDHGSSGEPEWSGSWGEIY